MPQCHRRKRVGASTADAPSASAPNLVWAVDFQFDSDERGRPIKICSIVDEHTRECIAGLADRSITATKLTDHLEALAAVRGAPATLRYDNGPELIREAMAHWAGTRTGLNYIPPGRRGATATSSRSTTGSATSASTSTPSTRCSTPAW